MSRLVLVMGVQRSGTTALLKALTSSGAVLGVNEGGDPRFFDGVALRPPTAVAAALAGCERPVVLKPINETRDRPLGAVVAALAAAGATPAVVWVYRDPVNVLHSHLQRWQGYRDRPEAFAADWARRNAEALATPGVVVVRYEDLVHDPGVLRAVAAAVDLPAAWTLRPDRGEGRRAQPAEVQRLVDAACAPTLAALHAARLARPGPPPPWGRAPARLVGRLRRGLFKAVGF